MGCVHIVYDQMFAVGVVCKHLSVQCMFFMTPAL